MAASKRLYTDVHVIPGVVSWLQSFGHDVLTIHQDCGNPSGADWPDDYVLQRATHLRRAVVTRDRDFIRQHFEARSHYGVILLKMPDNDSTKRSTYLNEICETAGRQIDDEIRKHKHLRNLIIYVPEPEWAKEG